MHSRMHRTAPVKIFLLASVGTDKDKTGLLGDTEDPGDCKPADCRCCSVSRPLLAAVGPVCWSV